jgi:hypothetical protein
MKGRISSIALAILTFFALTGAAYAVPGDTSKYTIIGAAEKAKSPTNSQDHVIRFSTSGTNPIAAVIRKVNSSVGSLEGLLSVDYYFVAPKTCGAASPRYSLFIDDDGDGIWESPAEKAVFGYIGPLPFGTGCQQDQWHHENLTDFRARWDLSQFGVAGLQTWTVVKEFFLARAQNETVVFIKLVEDSCSFAPTACGTSYYDTITMGDADLTLENWSDTTTGCSKEFESAFAC